MAVQTDALVPSPALSDVETTTRAAVWWKEVALVAGFYLAYAKIRNINGHHAGSPAQVARATRDAMRIIDGERWLHLFHEQGMQAAALHHLWLIKAANVFYGSCHFIVTAAVLVWLYRYRPDRYRRWRSILGVSTALALVGFTLFPTLPPRLLPAPYGFVDTLGRYGGLWTFNSGVVEHISDPFAAMPSLHLVWATWCGAALCDGSQRRWVGAVAVAYPIVTAVAVIITGNHYVLDLVAGCAVLAAGWWLVGVAERRRARGYADVRV